MRLCFTFQILVVYVSIHWDTITARFCRQECSPASLLGISTSPDRLCSCGNKYQLRVSDIDCDYLKQMYIYNIIYIYIILYIYNIIYIYIILYIMYTYYIHKQLATGFEDIPLLLLAMRFAANLLGFPAPGRTECGQSRKMLGLKKSGATLKVFRSHARWVVL